jgi:predicted GNAT family N-acyltransferase
MKEFLLIENLNPAQTEQLFNLFQKLEWTKTRNEISIMLKNSMSFGVVEATTQNLVGYSRVLTDEIKYAFIFDLIIDECQRKKGLGKLLMETIILHPKLKNVKNFELTCVPSMVHFYEKFGFSEEYISTEFGKVKPMRFSRIVG